MFDYYAAMSGQCSERSCTNHAKYACACRDARYCGRECQESDWAQHKPACAAWSPIDAAAVAPETVRPVPVPSKFEPEPLVVIPELEPPRKGKPAPRLRTTYVYGGVDLFGMEGKPVSELFDYRQSPAPVRYLRERTPETLAAVRAFDANPENVRSPPVAPSLRREIVDPIVRAAATPADRDYMQARINEIEDLIDTHNDALRGLWDTLNEVGTDTAAMRRAYNVELEYQAAALKIESISDATGPKGNAVLSAHYYLGPQLAEIAATASLAASTDETPIIPVLNEGFLMARVMLDQFLTDDLEQLVEAAYANVDTETLAAFTAEDFELLLIAQVEGTILAVTRAHDAGDITDEDKAAFEALMRGLLEGTRDRARALEPSATSIGAGPGSRIRFGFMGGVLAATYAGAFIMDVMFGTGTGVGVLPMIVGAAAVSAAGQAAAAQAVPVEQQVSWNTVTAASTWPDQTTVGRSVIGGMTDAALDAPGGTDETGRVSANFFKALDQRVVQEDLPQLKRSIPGMRERQQNIMTLGKSATDKSAMFARQLDAKLEAAANSVTEKEAQAMYDRARQPGTAVRTVMDTRQFEADMLSRALSSWSYGRDVSHPDVIPSIGTGPERTADVEGHVVSGPFSSLDALAKGQPLDREAVAHVVHEQYGAAGAGLVLSAEDRADAEANVVDQLIDMAPKLASKQDRARNADYADYARSQRVREDLSNVGRSAGPMIAEDSVSHAEHAAGRWDQWVADTKHYNASVDKLNERRAYAFFVAHAENLAKRENGDIDDEGIAFTKVTLEQIGNARMRSRGDSSTLRPKSAWDHFVDSALSLTSLHPALYGFSEVVWHARDAVWYGFTQGYELPFIEAALYHSAALMTGTKAALAAGFHAAKAVGSAARYRQLSETGPRRRSRATSNDIENAASAMYGRLTTPASNIGEGQKPPFLGSAYRIACESYNSLFSAQLVTSLTKWVFPSFGIASTASLFGGLVLSGGFVVAANAAVSANSAVLGWSGLSTVLTGLVHQASKHVTPLRLALQAGNTTVLALWHLDRALSYAIVAPYLYLYFRGNDVAEKLATELRAQLWTLSAPRGRTADQRREADRLALRQAREGNLPDFRDWEQAKAAALQRLRGEEGTPAAMARIDMHVSVLLAITNGMYAVLLLPGVLQKANEIVGTAANAPGASARALKRHFRFTFEAESETASVGPRHLIENQVFAAMAQGVTKEDRERVNRLIMRKIDEIPAATRPFVPGIPKVIAELKDNHPRTMARAAHYIEAVSQSGVVVDQARTPYDLALDMIAGLLGEGADDPDTLRDNLRAVVQRM